MLKIHFSCTPDYASAPTDYIIRVLKKTLNCHKVVLMSRSNYFSTLLNGNFKETNTEIILKDIKTEIFELILKTIYQESFDISDLIDALEYMLALNFFQVKQVDMNELLRQLIVPHNMFEIYMQYIDKLYPEGIPPEVVTIIASKTNNNTIITNISPELAFEIGKFHGSQGIECRCNYRRNKCESESDNSSDDMCCPKKKKKKFRKHCND